jgi:predicted carbohydrate-binding protein with CBM5 and CBM33 domain
MSTTTLRRSAPRRVVPLLLLALLLPATVVLVATVKARDASAHGSAVDPASRNYGCWLRWGSRFQSPAMASEDPMCDQAWKADPNAMWNWNGLYREQVKGQHQAAIPDGQLCSAGQTGGTRYAALDKPGAWKAQRIANDFSVTVHDQARHGADYYKVYVTRQGYDALTQPLRWSDLELVTTTGRYAPGAGSPGGNATLNGVSVSVPAKATGRTGRHIVYTIWQASHSDQSYYFCSDVIFGQGSDNPDPDPTPTVPATTTTTWTPTPTTTTPPVTTVPPGPTTTVPTPPVDGACAATYKTVNQWSGGFQGEVQVTAGASAIRGWTVSATLASGQAISQAWNATVSGTAPAVTATNAAWNGNVAAAGSTSFGFLASGTAAAPTLACAAT